MLLCFRGRDEKEMINISKTFKNKKSTDWNCIDMSIVKNIIGCGETHICNQFLQTGSFPSKMKTAKVIVIYKAGDTYVFSNYKPVSSLSQFSKILEKDQMTLS